MVPCLCSQVLSDRARVETRAVWLQGLLFMYLCGLPAVLSETSGHVPPDLDLLHQHGPTTCFQKKETALQGKCTRLGMRLDGQEAPASSISIFLCNVILILIHSEQILTFKGDADLVSTAGRSACWSCCPIMAETECLQNTESFRNRSDCVK